MDVILEVQCTCAGHWPGQSCTCPTKPYTTSITVQTECEDIGTVEIIPNPGGSGGGGSDSDFSGNDSVTTTVPPGSSNGASASASFLIEMLGGDRNLSDLQLKWIRDSKNEAKVNDFLGFFYINSNKDNILHALNIAIRFPDISSDLLQNWFIDSTEALELPVVIDPSLITYDQTLTQQSLPTYSDFVTNFPSYGRYPNLTPMETKEVYRTIGGQLYQSHLGNPSAYSNACSIRGSKALLYSGIDIPVLNYSGTGQRTEKGLDGNNYILDAVSFDRFMRDKFGEPHYELTGQDANNKNKAVELLKNKYGIYIIINNNVTTAGYSGHVDLIMNGRVLSGANLTPKGGVKSIAIWELE